MNTRSVFILRAILLTGAIGFLVVAALLFVRGRVTAGFLLAFAGLSTLSLRETDVDYQAQFGARSFLRYLGTGRSHVSTLGMLCHITANFCLLAALICWIVLH